MSKLTAFICIPIDGARVRMWLLLFSSSSSSSSFFGQKKTHRCYGKQFLSLFFFFQTLREKKRGQRVTCKCPEFEMLSARRSQTVSARYLNISGPRAERVQGCSLTSLCEPSAASDSQKREPGNNYSVSPGLGIRQGKASHPDTPLLFFFFFLKRMLN